MRLGLKINIRIYIIKKGDVMKSVLKKYFLTEEFGIKKYCFWFHHRVGKEIWQALPWRAKFGLIAIDVFCYTILIGMIVLFFRRFVLGESTHVGFIF